MKKFLSLLLSLCLLLGALPMQVLALPGNIFPSEGAVKTVTLDDGSLSLQNEYIHMTFRKLWGTYAYLTVAPAAKPDEEGVLIGQAPRCTFITYDQGREKTEGVVTEPYHRAGGGEPANYHRKLGIHRARGGSAHKNRSQRVFQLGR